MTKFNATAPRILTEAEERHLMARIYRIILEAPVNDDDQKNRPDRCETEENSEKERFTESESDG